MSRDGQTFSGRSSGEYLTPAGKIRVLVVLVRYADTFGADGLAMWVRAQRQINDDHAALVDLNPASQGGGLSVLPERFIFRRNFSAWRTPLDAAAWRDVARAAYHHEMAHHWGWPATHDWAQSCGSDVSGYAPFVVPPVLFGWEDLHGGHVPEILRK